MFIQIPTRTERGWNIAVPMKDNLWWSIVLSALMSCVDDENQFQQFLEILSGQEVSDSTPICNSVKRYNPFLNRYSCFFKEELIELVQLLKERVECVMGSSFPYTAKDLHFRKVMNKIASTLHCGLSIHFAYGKDHKIMNFPSTNAADEPPTCSRFITLNCLVRKRKKKPNRLFSFPLHKRFCQKLRHRAFLNIFRDSDKPESFIENLYSELKNEPDLAILLFRLGYLETLQWLLGSHRHILDKLTEAGFLNDHSKVSTKKELFTLALNCNDKKFLYLVYDYITARAQSMGASTRDPNDYLIRTLNDVSKALLYTLKSVDEMCTDRLLELINFHSYVYRMSKSIREVQSSPNLSNVQKAKNIILTLLEAYRNRFYFLRKFLTKDKYYGSVFEEFRSHFEFFHNLDYHSALLFFDNIYSLKNCLPSKDSAICEEVESSYARFLFIMNRYWKYLITQFPILQHSNNDLRFSSVSMIMLVLRQEFERKLLKFHQCIDDIDVKNIESVQGSTFTDDDDYDVYTLRNEPEIKDEVMLSRFKEYLNLVVSRDTEREMDKNVLIIERTLQIVGESLKLDPREPLTLIKSLLVSVLPEQTTKDLREIRNNLCHYFNEDVNARLAVESNDYKNVFVEVQVELTSMYPLFKHIFKLQELRIKTFVFENVVSRAELISSDVVFPILCDAEYLEKIFNAGIEEAKSILQTEKENLQNSLRENIMQYFRHFTNHVDWLNEYIQCLIKKEEKSNYSSKGKLKKEEKRERDEIFSRLLCIYVLIEFIDRNAGLPILDHAKLDELVKDIEISQGTCYPVGSDIICEYLERFMTLGNEVFEQLGVQNSTEEAESVHLNYSHIHELREMLSKFKHGWLSRSDYKLLLSKIPEKYVVFHSVKVNILSVVKNVMSDLEIDIVREQLERLDSSSDTVESLKTACERGDRNNLKKYLKSMPDEYGSFELCLQKHSIEPKDFDKYCKLFDFKPIEKRILNNIKIFKGAHLFPENLVIDFFWSKVDNILKFLVESDLLINRLWTEGRSIKTKNFAHDILVKRLITQKPIELQAIGEMMYFNTVGTMLDNGNRGDLRKLREELCQCLSSLCGVGTMEAMNPSIKLNRLFSGLRVRNLLGHGYASYEISQQILDPGDFPSEIIKVLLKLLEMKNERQTKEIPDNL